MAVLGQLASLVGEWRGVGDSAGVSVTYTLVADGSALVEEFRPSQGSAMMTMFSVDGDHLLATHYCSAGNQPQMTTSALTRSPVRSLDFSLVRITGMKTTGDWHNTPLEVLLEDEDHFMQRWTYLDQGKTGTRVFHFERH